MTGTDKAVLIMAGGTGGHIYPGLAFAETLLEQGIPVRWLGASGSMESRKVPEHGIGLDTVAITGVRGKGLLGWLMLPFRLAAAVRSAMRFMGRERTRCAVSFGGYAAGPGGIAAWLKGIPLVVHEQNRIPGMTNRVLARLARRVLQAFPGTFPTGRAVTCGNPVRASVTGLPEPAIRFSQRQGAPRLLITGGSQGARVLNRLVPEAVALLPSELRPSIRHQAGSQDVEHTGQVYRELGLEAEVSVFIEDMAAAYGWADLVICRSGALTVSELAAAGLGSILVPYPHAVDDHQTANAAYLAEGGAAVLQPESGLTPESLCNALQPLLADRGAMLDMAQRARGLAVPDAARNVYHECREWLA